MIHYYRDDIIIAKVIEFAILYPNILPQEPMDGYVCGIQLKVTKGRIPTIIHLNKVTDHKLYQIACQVEAREMIHQKDLLMRSLLQSLLWGSIRIATNWNQY